MSLYLSIDGGGSKIIAFLFDQSLNIHGYGRSGGINTNTARREECEFNIRTCLNEVFCQKAGLQIEKVYCTMMTSPDFLLATIREHAFYRNVEYLNEACAGLIAGGLCEEGISAICGTGSKINMVNTQHEVRTKEGKRLNVGGWGSIVGDDGSGAWMGIQAVHEALKAYEGWGEKTSLFDAIMRFWQLSDPNDIKKAIYQSHAPYRKLATLTEVLATEAVNGDAVSIRILKSAGNAMASQVCCLIERCEFISEQMKKIVCIGGAWKTHPLVFNTFLSEVKMRQNSFAINRAYFEPVAAGIIKTLWNAGKKNDEVICVLKSRIPDLMIKW